MRRVMMLVAVALVMAAMMAVNAGPAFADHRAAGTPGCVQIMEHSGMSAAYFQAGCYPHL